MKPRLRIFSKRAAGGYWWLCIGHAGTANGWGMSPLDAYRMWQAQLPWEVRT